jgi:hypothetical protein
MPTFPLLHYYKLPNCFRGEDPLGGSTDKERYVSDSTSGRGEERNTSKIYGILKSNIAVKIENPGSKPNQGRH